MPAPPLPSPSAPPRPRLAKFIDLLAAGVGIRSLALTILALLGIFYTLHFAAPVLLPIVLALLLSLLLAPLVRQLHQRARLPRGLAAGLVLGGLVLALGTASAFVVAPASAWVQTVPEKLPELKNRLSFLKKPFEQMRETSAQVENLASASAPGAAPPAREPSHAASLLMSQTPIFLTNLFVGFILLYFMLSSGDIFLRKLVRMVPSFTDKRRAVEIAREIEDRISRYLRTVTVINLGLGVAVAAGVGLAGLPNYVLWGAVAFVLNFIPYLGGAIGITAMLAVGLLTFQSAAYACLPPAIYLLLNTIEGNFITPIVVGRILTLNPVVIFVFLMFWGWIWGVAGALLAVPILAALKIICDHLQPLAPIGEFIGGEPAAPVPG